MKPIDILLTRHSVRTFRAGEVDPETQEQILRAAMNAPSSADEQPWHFYIVEDPDILQELPKIHPYAAMAAQASLAIVVCGEPRLEVHAGMWVQDCAAATQNILLAAHALDLGAVWVGVHPRKERIEALRKLLRIPEGIEPFAIVPIGYPAEVPTLRTERFHPGRIHRGRW